MKIVVIGGSGLIGSRLVEKLSRPGHTVISASRQSGINTITGEGLNEVMEDAEVVVDVINARSMEGRAVLDFFRRSTINLLTAEAYASVKHHIALSVVGADRLPGSGYFQAKLAQEELIKLSGIPYSILRSTQFYELAGRIAQAGTIGEEVFISPVAFQPIAAEEVVEAISDIALGLPLNATAEIAGPVLMPMYEFIRYYLTNTEDPRQLKMDEHARYFGAELTNESLVPGDNPQLGKIKYEDWFTYQLVHQ
jgi:uncharacterized protein YbjT (DUF2867 family)